MMCFCGATMALRLRSFVNQLLFCVGSYRLLLLTCLMPASALAFRMVDRSPACLLGHYRKVRVSVCTE